MIYLTLLSCGKTTQLFTSLRGEKKTIKLSQFLTPRLKSTDEGKEKGKIRTQKGMTYSRLKNYLYDFSNEVTNDKNLKGNENSTYSLH
ncbi:CLUMA_CG017485, isoform A [Clunio marinus]|uniref:CLUMA_CG017485, isoform A n=1 Tax=Clunio marinus TaxID=568069 RepID=A0A1J1IW50_9DIPT|nr:CLUMA_CG017485, isoform A [Clunio marinus]